MPTNANVFNSRVTSESLEAKFRQVFPAQGGAELVQDLFASGVIQPVVDFSSVAEGSVLPENLQTAWDFSTGHQTFSNSNATIINNTGFWRIQAVNTILSSGVAAVSGQIAMTDGLSTKPIWEINEGTGVGNVSLSQQTVDFVVFVRAGDSVTASSNDVNCQLDVFWRQIADVNGNLVNPLGFTFS